MNSIKGIAPQNGEGGQQSEPETADKPDLLAFTDKIEAGELRTVKCYHCFSYQVEAVCHHCGRFLCSRCLKKTSGWLFADNVFAHIHPSVDSRLSHGAHCKDCFHLDLQAGPVVILVSSLLALLVLWITWPHLDVVQRELFSSSMVLTIAIITLLAFRFHPFWVSYPYGFPPLFSRTKIKIQEQVRANFQVNGGNYLSSEPTAEGVIEVKLTVGPNDKARYENAPPPKCTVGLHAGFIALETVKNVEFERFNSSQLRNNLLYLIKTVNPDEFERLCNRSGDLYLVKPYRIRTEALQVGPPHNKEFPLLIKPRRANGGYRLEVIFEALKKKLILKYAKDGSEKEGEQDKGLDGKPILETFSLKIPLGCEVERTNGYHDKQERMVRWYRQRLDMTPPYAAWIEFRHILKNEIEFVGEYVVAVDDWTISQLHVAPENTSAKNKFIIRPANGLRLLPSKKDKEDKKKGWILFIKSQTKKDKKNWLEPIVEHQTKIKGKLCFNTSYLFSQQVQMASGTALNKNQAEVKGKEELLIAPTHHVINVVVEALTRENIFIQNMLETLGDIKETGTSSYRTKCWEISGKYFIEGTLQPVRFHLIILGEGAQSYRPNSEGVSTFEFSLRSYVEMTDLIQSPDWLKEEYGRLRNIIKIAAYQSRYINYKGRRILAWQREKQFECDLRRLYPLDRNSKLSIILTGDNHPKKMCIFISPPTEAKRLTQLPKDLIFPRPHLPSIGDGWIDKWELLKEAELELHHGRK